MVCPKRINSLLRDRLAFLLTFDPEMLSLAFARYQADIVSMGPNGVIEFSKQGELVAWFRNVVELRTVLYAEIG